MPRNLLFLCTGNSCRSQMAEGWTRHLKPDDFVASSAGLTANGLNPIAVEVMREAGVDISRQVSQTVSQVDVENIDVVITVCSHADANCPTFSTATRVVHVPFDDPPVLARTAASAEEAKDHYRRVRDEIRDFVQRLPESAGLP